MDRLDATRGRRTIARPGTGERPVGPPDHSPGRNPGAKRHTPPTNRAARPEWMYRPARIRPHRVPAPPPGFRPGLWSTGPTARPGTGERPVGAPDHSQGRNPWAAKPWAANPRAKPGAAKPGAAKPPAVRRRPDAPRKVSKRAAERFRRVGKLKNAPLKVSEASESSKTHR